MATKPKTPSLNTNQLNQQLTYLKLPFIKQHFETLTSEAAQKHWPHLPYLAKLINGESQQRYDRSIQRRITQARFPIIKTLEQFKWTWPKKNQPPSGAKPLALEIYPR